MRSLLQVFYRLLLVIVTIAVAGEFALSQQNPPDTFEARLNRITDDSTRLEKATNLAKYFENIDTAVAWKYFRIAKAIADKKNDESSQIKVLEIEGVLYTKNNPARAYVLYQKAIGMCQEQKANVSMKRYEASLMNNLGVISYMNGDYEGAISSFIESVKIYETYDISNGNLCPTLDNISTTYGQLSYPSKALEYSRESVKYAEKFGDAKLKATGYIGLGANFITMGKLDSGKATIEHALQLTRTTGNQYDLYLCELNMGLYYDKLNNDDSSLFYLNKALPLAISINSPYDAVTTLNKLANIEMGKKDFKTAKIHLDSALSAITTYQFRDAQKDWYHLAAEYYNRTGDPVTAVTYFNKYDDLKDSLFDETKFKRIDFLQARYESEKKQNSIDRLEKEKKIQQLNLRQNSTLNYILIGSLAVLLMIGFLIYRNYRQKQQLQQQKISELEKDSQLMAVDAMLKGQEDERSRLAKDLHDGLGGMLSGVKFSLSNMKDNLIMTADNMSVFERSLDMIDNSIRELRRVAHNMMPEMLTRFGLDEALKEYCNTVNSTRLVVVKYQSFGMDQRIEKSTEIILYRIVQELLNNILKHAAATEAFVQLIRENKRLSVIVEDNGKGFDPSLPSNNEGAGWINIRSRVEYLKGQLDIHSEPGKGTLVTIEIELE